LRSLYRKTLDHVSIVALEYYFQYSKLSQVVALAAPTRAH